MYMDCAKCGAKLSEGTKFCAKCGAQVGQADTKPLGGETLRTEEKSLLKSAVYVIAFVLAFVGVRYLTSQGISSVSESMSKQDTIKATVLSVRNSTTFPRELDEVTTWTGISEQTGAIRYEYAFHDANLSNINNQALANLLIPSVCKDSGTKNILDKDIDLQYFYRVTGSSQTYMVSINKANCI
jgi:hypothetical protein